MKSNKFTLYDDSKYENHATNELCRNFGECYELGKKDMKEQMMDKACEWLEDNLLSYWQQCVTDPEEFIKEFHKAMEEEK